MDEYINKNLALSELNKVPAYFENGDIHYGIALAINIVKKLPVVTTSEVKLGTWTLNTDGTGTCSECNMTQYAVYDQDNWQRYCGCCGARMTDIKSKHN